MKVLRKQLCITIQLKCNFFPLQGLPKWHPISSQKAHSISINRFHSVCFSFFKVLHPVRGMCTLRSFESKQWNWTHFWTASSSTPRRTKVWFSAPTIHTHLNIDQPTSDDDGWSKSSWSSPTFRSTRWQRTPGNVSARKYPSNPKCNWNFISSKFPVVVAKQKQAKNYMLIVSALLVAPCQGAVQKKNKNKGIYTLQSDI